MVDASCVYCSAAETQGGKTCRIHPPAGAYPPAPASPGVSVPRGDYDRYRGMEATLREWARVLHTMAPGDLDAGQIADLVAAVADGRFRLDEAGRFEYGAPRTPWAWVPPGGGS